MSTNTPGARFNNLSLYNVSQLLKRGRNLPSIDGQGQQSAGGKIKKKSKRESKKLRIDAASTAGLFKTFDQPQQDLSVQV